MVSKHGAIFIYCDEKSTSINTYCCYCGEYSVCGPIRTNFSNCWVSKEGCRYATTKEKTGFLKRLETEEHLHWNPDRKIPEPITGRAEPGDYYYYIDANGDIIRDIDEYTVFDDQRYELGNYS